MSVKITESNNHPQKLLNSQFLVQTAIQIFLTGVVVFFVQKYYEDRLTTKRIKREVFNAAKREAFSNAISIIYREIAVTDFKTDSSVIKKLNNDKRYRGAVKPTEYEINDVYGKLYLYAKDSVVLNSYAKLLSKNREGVDPVRELQRFLDAVNKEINGLTSHNLPLTYLLTDTTGVKFQ